MDFSKMTAPKLYRYGVDNPNTPHADDLVDALIATKNVATMIYAGEDWCDGLYSEKLLDVILKQGSIFDMYSLFSRWKLEKYEHRMDEIFNFFFEGDFPLAGMGRYIPIEYYDSKIVDKMIEKEDVSDLIDAGRRWPDEKYDRRILDALIKIISKLKTSTVKGMYYSAILQEWPEDRLDEVVMNAFINNGEARLLYNAGWQWHSFRFSEKIVDKLIQMNEYDLLSTALSTWHCDILERYKDKIIDFLVNNAPPSCLYHLGVSKTIKHYDDRILDSLIASGNAEYIELAGSKWHRDRWNEKIVDGLLDTKDTHYISTAIINWYKYRYDSRLLDFILENGSIKELVSVVGTKSVGLDRNVMKRIVELCDEEDYNKLYPSGWLSQCPLTTIGEKWDTNEFSADIARIFFKHKNSEKLYNIGSRWSDVSFIPLIGHCLYELNDEKWIFTAMKNWDKDRIKTIGKKRIVVSY